MDEVIRSILDEYGRLACEVSDLDDDDDLYQMGLTSHGTVNVMLALEEAFELEIPDTMLRKSTFQSVAHIRTAIVDITSNAQSA
jgi:acyl carrier protein